MLWVSMRKEGILCGAESATWKQTKKFVLFAVLKPLTTFRPKFTGARNRFLQHLKTITNDEDSFITRLAKLATGLRIEDWDAATSEKYFSAIESYKKTAKEFHSSVVAETINATSSYQIVFADEEGQSTTRRFDKIEVSARGKLLFNQITASLDAMGHSISEQEKRQILMEVLKKLC